jgi:hypothetical protein
MKRFAAAALLGLSILVVGCTQEAPKTTAPKAPADKTAPAAGGAEKPAEKPATDKK